jgi:glycine/serine hydroxymethyltransferase
MILSFGSGCTSTSGGSGRYLLKQTRDDIDFAMVRYHNRATFGFLTANEQQQVSAAYKAYQTAFNEAVQQAHSNYNAPTPNNVKTLADQLLSVLASIP